MVGWLDGWGNEGGANSLNGDQKVTERGDGRGRGHECSPAKNAVHVFHCHTKQVRRSNGRCSCLNRKLYSQALRGRTIYDQ